MFQLKTYRPGMKEEKNSFFILNKGLNSGKPMNEPCPNCFVCSCMNEEDKEKLYWLVFALWQSKEVKMLLIGSVIPYVRISEFEKLLKQHLKEKTLLNMEKHFLLLTELNQKEKLFKAMYLKLGELKIAYSLSMLS
jgi:hypothetical protein